MDAQIQRRRRWTARAPVGPGYQIDCVSLMAEISTMIVKSVLPMAHAGPNTGGSQFYVCHSRNNTSHLDGAHTCFGKVIEGVEEVDETAEGDAIEAIVFLV